MNYVRIGETMKESRIPEFITILDKMKELHIRKNADYANDSNPFDNFDFSEEVMARFSDNRDKAFVWPIATKLARLGNLLSSDKPPNNESIEDSMIDIAVYMILWKCDLSRRSNEIKTMAHL
jgi:hypothetical protein